MKILIAMDASRGSQAAMEEVVRRPWPPNSAFEVISVAEPSHLWTTSDAAQEAVGCAQEVVDRAVERLGAAGFAASGATATGDPKTVILDRARSLNADLLVAGASSASPLTELFLGNVAAALLRYAPCSVEIARAEARTAGTFKILLATDGSGFSEQAAKAVAAAPWPESAEVRVLSVVELALPPVRAMFEVPALDSAFIESAREEAMKRSQDAIARAREILSATALTVSESISVLLDTPKAIILQEAAEWGAGLVVLGSHGRSGVDRFLVGSVSEAVAMRAGCSVQVVRKAP